MMVNAEFIYCGCIAAKVLLGKKSPIVQSTLIKTDTNVVQSIATITKPYYHPSSSRLYRIWKKCRGDGEDSSVMQEA